ncbi:unnamed protein product [Litomosoides sigmodontis]|uniref:Craniofacial development protein 1 n=1 Tax=Litomosoides sigmodontis TaxID=42156 RepID=A0A3P6U718_LITSI|nr:unnamed protein product [Litomosoides sigmodontis]
MFRNDEEEEENGSEDDEDYVPSGPEEDVDDEQNESGDDDSVVSSTVVAALQESNDTNESEETEDERQRRLKSLFEEFIGGNDARPKSSTGQALPVFIADGKQITKSMDEIPKLAAQTADDIFGGVSDEGGVLLNSKPEFCERGKASGLAQREKRKAFDGLTATISALSKKSKMSVLERTAQDWGAFKTETGIQEELISHNRGKQGYVDRVEFLSRTDYRQFEMERDARNAARKKK